jgi:hypothetical protein
LRVSTPLHPPLPQDGFHEIGARAITARAGEDALVLAREL